MSCIFQMCSDIFNILYEDTQKSVKKKKGRVLQKGQIMSSNKKNHAKRERELRTRKKRILGNKGKNPGLSANKKEPFVVLSSQERNVL